ncbi:Phage Holliday junction resolvase [Devosia sp. H5989]|nr:Phage Holliday junction resolvase [Devosia sp. H5989]
MIEIVLLGEPVAKGRPRTNLQTGVVYTPEKTRTYEQMLRLAATDVMGGKPPLDGPLVVDMLVVKSIPRSWPKKKQEAARAGSLLPTGKPDWDNFGKVVDAANMVVWVDDGQIVDGRVRKSYGDKPGMWIRITPLEGVFG